MIGYTTPGSRWVIIARARAVAQGILAALACTCVALAHAQPTADFPNRPIRLIVPYAPGGSSDSMARVVAQHLGEGLGQPVVVENKSGASGVIGADAAAKAKPDGYTLLLHAAPLVMQEPLGMKLPYDPIKSFAPVSMIGSAPIVIAAHPSQPYRDLKGLVAASKAAPSGLTYATPGTGSLPHLLAELLRSSYGAKLTHAPYRGSAAAAQDVLAGHIPLLFDGYLMAGVEVSAGKLQGIALASTKRSALLPDLPTTAEQGFPDLVASSFYGILAPAGTPRPIVDKLRAAIVTALQQAEVRKLLAKQGVDIVGSTPEEFAAYMQAERARWTPIIKAAGVTVEQ